jgi:protein-histidine pros-kinase
MTPDEISNVLSVLPDAVVGVARDHTVIFFNQSAVSVFGFAPEEIVGKPLDMLLPESARLRHQALVGDFVASEQRSLVMHQRREVSGRRRDGTLFPAEVSLAKGWWQGQPVMFAILRDISELRRGQAILEASERRYRAVIEASPEPILISDYEEGIVVEANAAAEALFERPRAELIGLHFTDLHSEKTRQKRCKTFREHVESARITVPDAVMVTGKGREIPIEIYAAPVEIDGRLRVVGFFRDMTDRIAHTNRLEQALQEANAAVQAKHMFLTNMTHELRTPLNGIIGFAELLSSELHGPHTYPSYREYAEIIHQSGQHLLSLVNDLLDLSSLQLGKLTLAEEPIEVAAVAHQCHAILQKMLTDSKVHLDIDIRPDFALMADRRGLKQMLLNLLSNALKYSGPDSEIRVTAAVNQDGAAMISVIDHGAGIEPERLARIVEPFGASGNQYTRKKGGTGIGLSITKGLIERHGGRFEIDSVVGRGTVARLLFPRERLLPTTPRLQAS